MRKHVGNYVHIRNEVFLESRQRGNVKAQSGQQMGQGCSVGSTWEKCCQKKWLLVCDGKQERDKKPLQWVASSWSCDVRAEGKYSQDSSMSFGVLGCSVNLFPAPGSGEWVAKQVCGDGWDAGGRVNDTIVILGRRGKCCDLHGWAAATLG